jgi:hypothetical protein
MMRYIANFKLHYKTELCRNWKELGTCEFGAECAYAHGYRELNHRRRNTHRNYKTKMCKQWHETTPGTCTYGGKCQFIHGEKPIDELSDEPQMGFLAEPETLDSTPTNSNVFCQNPFLMQWQNMLQQQKSCHFTAPFNPFFGNAALQPIDQIHEAHTNQRMMGPEQPKTDDFKNIEKNLKKEILDDSFCSESAGSVGEDSCGEDMEPSQGLGLRPQPQNSQSKVNLNRLQIFSQITSHQQA